MTCYKFVTDDRKPVLIEHSKICYPPANENNIDQVDTSYPGVVIQFDKGYLLEDGVHRIAKFQRQNIFESLFYIVTIEEYKRGMVHMMFQGESIPLGEWNHNQLSPIKH